MAHTSGGSPNYMRPTEERLDKTLELQERTLGQLRFQSWVAIIIGGLGFLMATGSLLWG